MKRSILTLLCSLTGLTAFAQLSFKISKPLCVFTFLETASGNPRTSITLREHISKNISAADTASFNAIVREFINIKMDHTYVIDDYPESRQKPRSPRNLIKMAAVQSNSNEEFLQRISGVLPNEQWLKLRYVMEQATSYYDKMIWNAELPALNNQLQKLRGYTNSEDIFKKLITFYGSTWSAEMPFTVAIYPIPGSKGSTRATPHNNSLVLAVLTGEVVDETQLGIVFHEIGHVLYEEQPLALQHQIDAVFRNSTSLYAQYAYNYLDEALATACGNGWGYEHISGKPNTGSWYNNDYINRYAHAIFPMVKEYINTGRSIDAAFINNAITAFEKEFPDAAYSFENLMNSINFYTDASNMEQYTRISNLLNSYYRISSSYSSYPITDPQALDQANTTTGTQIFIVHKNHHDNFKALKAIFPELKTTELDKEALISFIDKKRRPVIVMNVKSEERIEAGLKKMESWKKIDPRQPVRIIE